MAASSPPPPPPPSASSSIDVFWHEGMLDHDTGVGVFDTGFDPGFLDVLDKHPENSDRIKNMLSILKRGPISPHIAFHSGRTALVPELLSFHSPEYINELIESDKNGKTEICGGTFLNPGSWQAALLASGTTLSAMKHILDGKGKLAFSLVRPPGHHAQPTRADGYCFLNNAGIAINLALDSGIEKVAVVDIDVHYGNGTAEGFYQSNRVLTVSLHMNHGSWGPSHPQSGSVDEMGEGEGFGYNVNVPLPNGTGDLGYEYAMMNLVVPVVEKFEPSLIVFVVGQDSSAFDPNGRQCLTMNGYRKIGRIMRGLANKYSDGRILVVQEGGYHVTYSAYCLHATLEGLLDLPETLLDDPVAYYPEDEAFSLQVVDSIKRYHRENLPFWKAPKRYLDQSIEADEETLESIAVVADLAGICTSREANHRPDMGHVVNVLTPLVEKWKPMAEEAEENMGIDYDVPLPQMLKVWQEAEKSESATADNSTGSIPARPAGFADSFTSADGR